MPPELAAAAGMKDIPSENLNGKIDGTTNDLGRGSMRMRPPLVCILNSSLTFRNFIGILWA